MLFLGIILWKGASRFNGGVCFSDGGAPFLSGECTPWGGTSVLMRVFSKKIVGWGAPQPCSEELGKCPPPSAAVQRFINVRERKPR